MDERQEKLNKITQRLQAMIETQIDVLAKAVDADAEYPEAGVFYARLDEAVDDFQQIALVWDFLGLDLYAPANKERQAHRAEVLQALLGREAIQ